MRRPLEILIGTVMVLGLGLSGLIGTAKANEIYKLSTLAPGSSSFIVGTSFARLVMKYVPGVEIRINSTGTGTRQTLDMARGKIDFAHYSGATNFFMVNRKGPFKNVKNAPELAKNLRDLFSFPLGAYTGIVYADSGIKSLMDIKGKKVYLGPPGGGATAIITRFVKAATKYRPGKDFKTVKLGWSAARQAFLDRNIDVWFSSANNPDAKIQQIALANKIRILSLSDANIKSPGIQKLLKIPGLTVSVIPPDVYGSNQVNTKPSKTIGLWLGFGTNKNLPEKIIYKIIKAYWEHIDEIYPQAPWLKNIRRETALKEMMGVLHPGAYRYYREAGFNIPKHLIPK